MGAAYQAVQWNRQKRLYDGILAGAVILFLVTFCAVTGLRYPQITAEILLIRAFGVAAFLLLHFILCIGPACRLSPMFLPFLYNRRHAGVTMAFLGTTHAVLAIATYHAGGDTNPVISIFRGSPITLSIAGVPFQVFGLVALLILLLMAATSHDFWLANLSAPVWKTLHMLVYVAYALLLLHVAFGVLQSEIGLTYSLSTGLGLAMVVSLHLIGGCKEARQDKNTNRRNRSGTSGNGGSSIVAPLSGDEEFVEVCAVSEIPESRARIVCVSGERVAIFKYDGKVSAVSNLCQHQNGPLGEGKIIDGCITCPWHGYQYLPETGASPPPFVEKVPTFSVRVKKGRVLIHPKPNRAGTRVEPAEIEEIQREGERVVSTL